MKEYITLFDTHSLYTSYSSTNETFPNVSHCKDVKDVHYTLDKYIHFEDPDIKLLCCLNWGDYKKIVITDNGDDTVNIQTTTYIRKSGTTTTDVTLEENVDKGTHVIGTTYEAIGIRPSLCRRVSSTVDIMNLSTRHYVTLTSNFSTTTPIYGIEYNNSNTRKADCFVNFNTDMGHYLRVYLWYGYYGYIDGGSGYGGITSEWRQLKGTTKYIALLPNVPRFSTYMTLPYVTFRSIDGYRPANYNLCQLRVIV